MTRRSRIAATAALTLAVAALSLAGAPAAAGAPADLRPVPEGGHTVDADTARGTFTVDLAPLDASAEGLGRMTITKTYRGDLEGTATGEMLTWRDPSGAAAYTALERVSGTLHGRSGSFVLAHRGMMTASEQNLSVTIVPGSGTGELEGLTGHMEIDIVERIHYYVIAFEQAGRG